MRTKISGLGVRGRNELVYWHVKEALYLRRVQIHSLHITDSMSAGKGENEKLERGALTITCWMPEQTIMLATSLAVMGARDLSFLS